MNYFLTRRHYTRVAVVPPRCFAEKLARTACLALCHGTFSLLLATPPPPLTERALFMSRQASGSRRASLPATLPQPFPFLRAPPRRSANSYTQRQARRSVRDTVSLTLLRYTAVSFPPMARWNRNRRTREAQPTFSSLLFSSGSLYAALFPPFLGIWKPAHVGLTFPRCNASRLMKSRVKCRIERQELSICLDVAGKVSGHVCACVYVYQGGLSVEIDLLQRGERRRAKVWIQRASFNKTNG